MKKPKTVPHAACVSDGVQVPKHLVADWHPFRVNGRAGFGSLPFDDDNDLVSTKIDLRPRCALKDVPSPGRKVSFVEESQTFCDGMVVPARRRPLRFCPVSSSSNTSFGSAAGSRPTISVSHAVGQGLVPPAPTPAL